MGFLSAAKGLMGLGNSKTRDDLFDKDSGLLTQVGGWIGNAHFTEEERAELNAKIADGVRQFAVDTLSENTDRSKARREIAVFFIKFYCLMLFMAGMVYPVDAGWSAVWVGLATSIAVGGLVSSISIFFFGSHAVAKFQSAKK